MVIAQGKDVKLAVFDIECYRELFDFGAYNPETKEWFEFEVSAYKNELFKFVGFYQNNPEKFEYYVSYNGLGYDHQVLQYILHKYNDWSDLTALEICKKISDFSGRIIDNGKYNIPMPYKEFQFPVKPIDVFKINHFDNEAKRTSLKWCEFMMDMDVEEMPVHFLKENLTEKEVEMTRHYRRHDVIATTCLLYVTMGQLDNAKALIKDYLGYETSLAALADYKDKNQIEVRFFIQEDSGLNCLNWSEVKIGEERNKVDYMKSMGIKDEKSIYPKKVKQTFGQPFRNFFPPTVEYKTDQIKKFFKDLGNQFVKNQKQEFPITFGGANTTYTIAKGGIHSTEKNRKVVPITGMILRDADVGAQYPRAIQKYVIIPPHLAPAILTNFNGVVDLKAVYKAQGKKAKEEGNKALANKLKGLETGTKLQMNGGFYGKLGQPGSFLEYPEGVLKICMGNQMEILMLVEMLEAEGINVISGNTDGIVSYFPADKEAVYKKICKDWEKKVGNDVLGNLEYADFAGLWQESINHYIARQINYDKEGNIFYTTKKKGRFMTEFEMHKNKSKRIIPLAMEQYFINGKDPVEFIKNHTVIFDFLIGVKGYGDLHYEKLKDNECIERFDKVLAYYVSTDGHVIKKRGWHKNKDGIRKYMDNFCEAVDKVYPWTGQPLLTPFNKVTIKPMAEYNINYDWYILTTLKRIDAIEKTKKARSYAEILKNKKEGVVQVSMF